MECSRISVPSNGKAYRKNVTIVEKIKEPLTRNFRFSQTGPEVDGSD
jgi:hypothetical protein